MDILRDTQPQGTHRVAFLDWGWLKKHAASAIPSVTSTCKVRGEGREEPVPVCVSYVNGSCCCYCTVDPDTPTPLLFPRTHTHNTHTHTHLPSFLPNIAARRSTSKHRGACNVSVTERICCDRVCSCYGKRSGSFLISFYR